MQEQTRFTLNTELLRLDKEIEAKKLRIIELADLAKGIAQLLEAKIAARAAIYSDLYKAGYYQVVHV